MPPIVLNKMTLSKDKINTKLGNSKDDHKDDKKVMTDKSYSETNSILHYSICTSSFKLSSVCLKVCPQSIYKLESLLDFGSSHT